MRKISAYGETYRFPTTTRELKRHLLNNNINGNVVKWGGQYDIAVPEQPGVLIPTGVRCISNLTFDSWSLLFKKASLGYTYLKA